MDILLTADGKGIEAKKAALAQLLAEERTRVITSMPVWDYERETFAQYRIKLLVAFVNPLPPTGVWVDFPEKGI